MAGEGHDSSMRFGDSATLDIPVGNTYTFDRNPWVEIGLDIGFVLTLSLSDTVTVSDNSSRSSQPRRSMHQFRQRRV